MRLALSWGIQASHEMPLLVHPISFETPHTAILSGLFCTTKPVDVGSHTATQPTVSSIALIRQVRFLRIFAGQIGHGRQGGATRSVVIKLIHG
jgi:hypothetical protein